MKDIHFRRNHDEPLMGGRHSCLPILSVIVIALALPSCVTVGPDFRKPETRDAKYSDLLPSETDSTDDSQGPITPQVLSQWWETMDDPILTDLIQEALTGSLDIRGAQASIREARARLGIARAGLFPQIDASGVYARSGSSANMTPKVDQPGVVESTVKNAVTSAVMGAVNNAFGVNGGNPQAGNAPAAGNSSAQSMPLEGNYYQAGFDATWEIDVFGGTRRAVEAAGDDLQAQEENLKSVWVSLAAEIALSYINVRTYQQRVQVARDNVHAQTETLEILESRLKSGLSDELAVQQARYNLERTRSTIPTLRTGLESSMNALAVLTGVMPGQLHQRLLDVKPIPSASLKTVTGIPANTLRQRPDVRVAERALAAQTARIGQATAELYPKFYLLGSIGWESLEGDTLFHKESKAWSFGPSVSWPIFHSGSILNNIEAQDALQEQLLARYEKTLLTAAKEVRDALMAYAQEQQRRETLKAGVKAAQAAVDISQDKYKNGLTGFNNVLDAQRSLLSFQETLAVSEGTVSTNLIRLYKALGGGWQSMSSSTNKTTNGGG